MSRRSLGLLFVVALFVASSGCGSGNGGKQPAKIVAPPVRASVQARQDFLSIAKKIEGAAAFETMEAYIKRFEDPEQKWTWSDLDDMMSGYAYQTKVAYEKWRTAMIAENNKR